MWPRLLSFVLAAQLALSAASPLSDGPTVRVEREQLKSPLHLARRRARGYEPRHLRVEEIVAAAEASSELKREDVTPPDVGQMATFSGSYPEPTRLGTGFKFLANSNHQLDEQNIDNVAPPTTDQGETCAPLKRLEFVDLCFANRRYSQSEMEHVSLEYPSAQGTPTHPHLDPFYLRSFDLGRLGA